MKTKVIAGFALAVLLGATANAANVSFSPVTRTVGIGETFTMDLVGTGFNTGDLDGGGINFSFNTNVVNVNSVSVDTATWEFFSDNGAIDNALGMVTGIQFNSFESRQGDLTFATVEFIAIDGGTSLLGLAEFLANPFASGGSAYPGVTFDQNGAITAIPLPAGAWLFASALLAAAVRRSRAGCDPDSGS